MSGITDSHSIEQLRGATDAEVVYIGSRCRGQTIVEKHPDKERLTPDRSLALENHSPSGFEWGYGGSGPAQLVLALLLDYTGNEEIALAHTETPVRDAALSYLQDAIAGDIDAVVPYPALFGAHTVLTTYYGHSNADASRLLRNFMDAKRIHWYDGISQK